MIVVVKKDSSQLVLENVDHKTLINLVMQISNEKPNNLIRYDFSDEEEKHFVVMELLSFKELLQNAEMVEKGTKPKDLVAPGIEQKQSFLLQGREKTTNAEPKQQASIDIKPGVEREKRALVDEEKKERHAEGFSSLSTREQKRDHLLKLLTRKVTVFIPHKKEELKKEAVSAVTEKQKVVSQKEANLEPKRSGPSEEDYKRIDKLVDSLSDKELLAIVRDNDTQLYVDLGMGRVSADEFRKRARELARRIEMAKILDEK